MIKRILLSLVGAGLLAHNAQAQNANATLNTPAYNPGSQALSQDLSGHLRVGQADTTVTTAVGALTGGTNTVIPITNSAGVMRFNLTGLTGTGSTATIQGSVDGSNWSGGLTFYTAGGTGVTSGTTTDVIGASIPANGFRFLRFVFTTGTGTPIILTNVTAAAPTVGQTITTTTTTAIPAGANLIGSVNVAGNASTATHVSGTTSATAGVSSTIVAAAGVTKGIQIDNTCSTAVWVSPSLAVGTALTAVNSFTIPGNTIWVSSDWFPISGAWTIGSATAVACTFTADYK